MATRTPFSELLINNHRTTVVIKQMITTTFQTRITFDSDAIDRTICNTNCFECFDDQLIHKLLEKRMKCLFFFTQKEYRFYVEFFWIETDWIASDVIGLDWIENS